MPTYKDVDEYIKSFPKEVQKILQKIREIIKEVAPDSEETMSYKMPTFKLNGKYLIYFSGWKDHIGIYPFPSGINAFKEKFEKYITGKGTMQFQLNEPIPYDLLRELVKFRVEEVLKDN